MNSSTPLLTLLIHQFTSEQYYKKHDLFVARKKKWLEDIQKFPFENLSSERQSYYRDLWYWPPWRFNNIVGFAEIKPENDWTIIGHLYLPKGRFSKQKSLFVNYVCASANYETRKLSSLRTAIIEVITKLQAIVSPKKWKIEFDESYINHTDFLEMLSHR